MKSELKKTIESFIKEYEERIQDCDILLEINKENRRKLRRGEKCNFDVNDLSVEFARESTKKQAYIQFITVLKCEILGFNSRQNI